MTLVSPIAVLFVVAALAAGCGSGSAGNTGDGGTASGNTSGVTGSKKLPQLTDADRKAICDWTASLYGGYGKSMACGSLTVYAPANQAECLAEAALVPSTCQATVAQSEACVKAIADCDPSNEQTACSALMACAPTSP